MHDLERQIEELGDWLEAIADRGDAMRRYELDTYRAALIRIGAQMLGHSAVGVVLQAFALTDEIEAALDEKDTYG